MRIGATSNIFDDDEYHYSDTDPMYLTPVGYLGRFYQWVSSITFKDIQEIFYSVVVSTLDEIESFSINRGRVQKVTTQEPIGEVGSREIHPRVRVSAINGIQYTLLHARSLWTAVSNELGTKVHYVYYPTKGHQFVDGSTALWEKHFQINEQLVDLLVDHWKSLIEEVGGVNGPGVIYHIAHSQGGLVTSRAARKLPPEYRRKIHMITYGAHEHPLLEFASLTNVMCKADRIDYFNPYDTDHPSVVLIDPLPGGSIYDNHGVEPGQVYWKHIEMMAKDFRQKYESYPSRVWTWIQGYLPTWLGGSSISTSEDSSQLKNDV
jgi:hypothetical protein